MASPQKFFRIFFRTSLGAECSSIFQSLEQVHHFELERLREQEQTGQRDVHLPALECAHLGAMEPALISKYILSPAALQAQFPDALAQTPLKLLPLHQPQFRAILRKRILLIRRVKRDFACAPSEAAFSADEFRSRRFKMQSTYRITIASTVVRGIPMTSAVWWRKIIVETRGVDL